MKLLIGLAGALALATPAIAQQAKPFGSTPIPCNTEGFSNCRVSFDGSTVTRTFLHNRGGQTTQTNTGCTAQGSRISCPAGTYRTDKGFSGAAQSIVINLDRNGRPTSSGH